MSPNRTKPVADYRSVVDVVFVKNLTDCRSLLLTTLQQPSLKLSGRLCKKIGFSDHSQSCFFLVIFHSTI